MDLWRCQDSAFDLGHLVVDGDAKVLDVRVLVESGAENKVVDLLLAIGSRAGRRLDHGRRLHICELLDASLAGDDVADLQW